MDSVILSPPVDSVDYCGAVRSKNERRWESDKKAIEVWLDLSHQLQLLFSPDWLFPHPFSPHRSLAQWALFLSPFAEMKSVMHSLA